MEISEGRGEDMIRHTRDEPLPSRMITDLSPPYQKIHTQRAQDMRG